MRNAGGIERYIRTFVFVGFGQSTLSIGKETNQLAHHHFLNKSKFIYFKVNPVLYASDYFDNFCR